MLEEYGVDMSVKFDFLKGYNKATIQCNDFIMERVREHFSVKNAAASFNKKKLKYAAPPRKYVISNGGRFGIGIFPDIFKFLKSIGIEKVVMTDIFKERVMPSIANVDKLDDNLLFELRYYQWDSIIKAMRVGYGIFEHGTGAGKSLMTASLVTNILKHKPNSKILIIVPGTGLLNQLFLDFKEYELNVTYSKWGSKDVLQDTSVIIVNTEYLNLNHGSNGWIKNVDVLIQDECHVIHGGSGISKVVESIKTPNKFGLTGSLSKDKFAMWKCKSVFGNVIYKKPVSELIEEGFLTGANINMVKIIHPDKGVMNFTDEVDYISESIPRNSLIANKAIECKGNSLIIVNRLLHGENICNILSNRGKTIHFISGEMPVSERQLIIDSLEEHDDIVIVAIAKIFSTGINAKNLHNVLFAYGGKSFIRIVQSIGRGLRLHDSKDILTLWDFYDNIKYSMKHSVERESFYLEQKHPVTHETISLL
jgi:superfamily II DNA or RNA helicase